VILDQYLTVPELTVIRRSQELTSPTFIKPNRSSQSLTKAFKSIFEAEKRPGVASFLLF